MMRLTLALLVWLAPAVAAAQIAGVPVDALTPDGLERVDVSVSELANHGVRLTYAPAGQRAASLRIDVLVAPDARTAADAAAWFEQTVAGDLPPLTGLGDDARGDAGLIALRRDNVFVVVRSIDGRGGDCRAHAAAIDAALRAAPRGRPAADATLAIPALEPGLTPLQMPDAVLAAHVHASGSAAARRTRTGWSVLRRGDGPWSVRVVAADRLLRRIEASRNGS